MQNLAQAETETQELSMATCRYNSHWGGNLWCCQSDGCGGNSRSTSSCAGVGHFGSGTCATPLDAPATTVAGPATTTLKQNRRCKNYKVGGAWTRKGKWSNAGSIEDCAAMMGEVGKTFSYSSANGGKCLYTPE